MKKIFRRIFCLGSDGGSSTSAVVTTKDKDKLEKCPSFGSGDVEAWASTEIEQETFSFLWNLKNFNSIISKTTPASGTNDAKLDDEIKSPVFKGGSQGNLWQLKICPKEKIKKGEYLSAYLTLTSFGDGKDGKIKVRHQISLLDNRGNTVRSQTMNATTEFQKDTTKLVWIMRRKKILKNSHLLTKDDCLKIHCRIWIVGDFKHKTGSGITLTKDSADELRVKELHGLSDDFGKLLYLSETADVAISTLKHTFMAHRTILTARSPVFKRMLEIDMIESKTRSIDIPDFEKEVVQGMLEYIYTGHTESLVREAPELMQIAEKYQLGGLKENCEIQIANSLTVENAVQVLVLAHLHNATVLKPSVISFINLNKDAVKNFHRYVAQAKGNSHDAFVDLCLSQV